MKDRNIRRHHDQKRKEQVEFLYTQVYRDRHLFAQMDEKEKEAWIAAHASTRKRCSCWMCGNPRRYQNELTMQEKRKFQKER